MSGFEIAGVVLGAIPVIMAAINGFRTKKHRNRLRQSDFFLEQLIRSLRDQKYYLESDIRKALEASGRLETDKIDALLKGSAIADALEEYLGEESAQYRSAVEACQQILQDIVNDINGLVSGAQEADLRALVQAHPVKHSDRGYEFIYKIKLRLRKSNLEKRVKDLDHATSALYKIRNASVPRTEIVVKPASPAIAKLLSGLNTVRDYAHHLYSAISKAYVPGCHPEHEARLLLRSPPALIKQKKESMQVVFSLTFPHAPSSPVRSTGCYKANIRVLDEDVEGCAVGDGIRSKSSVRFSLPDASEGRPPPPPPKDLRDLCCHIKRVNDDKMPPNLFLSRHGTLFYHDYPSRPIIIADSIVEKYDDIVPLHCILQGGLTLDPALPRWSLIQRVALSYIVASSVLQLISTPWLQLPLTTESLYFSRGSSKLRDMETWHFPYAMPGPFIIQSFSKVPPPAYTTHLCDAKRSLAELGILLLELWFQRTLDSYASEAGLELDNSRSSRQDVAKEWLDSRTDAIWYPDIVERCLEGTFATSNPTLDGADLVFRQSVCEYVLEPLRNWSTGKQANAIIFE